MNLNLAKKHLFTLLFIPLFLISLYLKIVPVLNYNFVFTMDQARDMLDLRQIVVGVHPSLIGPTTSINGVYLGPFYYYFNILPFAISGGDPQALVYWNILWYMIAGILLFLFNYKENKLLAFFSAALFLMAPAHFYAARYFWSANPMPYITVFYFLSLITYLKNSNLKTGLVLGLISGLSMHFEAAFGVIFLPFVIFYSLFSKIHPKKITYPILGFSITLLPQILFELRHQFVMTKTFLNEISGSSQILGEKISFLDAQVLHLKSFIEFSGGPFELPNNLVYLITAIAIIYLLIKWKTKKLDETIKNYFLISFFFLLFSLLFYSWYLHNLKGWFLLGLRIPYIFILSTFFVELFKIKNTIPKILIILLLSYSFINTVILQSSFLPKSINDRSSDKSNLRNELEAIDWVYQKANSAGFKAYNYIPSVYDFPYQYLYWWHGTKKYGYQPEIITYKDNVPEYIKDNEKYLTKKRSAGEDPLVFLIYEKGENIEHLHAWLGEFTKLCSLDKVEYSWGTTAELRKACK